MRRAGYFLLLSAALHVAGVVVTGFATSSLILFGPAALYPLLYLGLARGRMWVAWIALLCMLGGATGTIVELAGAPITLPWVLWGILGADLAAAALLVAAIRTGPRTALSGREPRH